ncbi:MAG: sigma 54-interacting transcriptional regulator [Nitrospirae bacterium]|nr:sigma 54-interacting transcriptional regulator [Nitrospirota bacterium]
MSKPEINILPADTVLDIQIELAHRGIYKTLEEIVMEELDFDGPVPEGYLGKLYEDILRRVDLFKSLTPEALSELAAVAEDVILPAGDVVYKHSDRGSTYYVIARGSVTVRRYGIEGDNVTFATLASFEGFGEVALLTDNPRTASVETTEITSLILIPKDAFLKAVFSNPAAAKTCAGILAERLLKRDHRIVEASSANTAYVQFISEQLRRDEPMLIGNSRAILKLLSEIENIAGNNRPVLVVGEPGTEMFDVAGLIHELGKNSENLFMSMDAKTVDFAEAVDVNRNDPLFIELIQSGTLFGRGHNALPFAPDRRVGLLTMAGGGMVVIENIECLAQRVQELLADYIEKGCFHAVGEKGLRNSNARIIVTSSADLTALAASGGFDRRLNGMISVQTLTVPPLRKRKKDIGQIVDELIKRSNRQMGKNVSGIEEAAYKSIMGYDWPGNTEELRVVIRRAVSIAGGDKLTVEDLFIGPPPVTGKFTFNLLNLGPVMKFFQSRLYPKAALLLTAPFIALIVGLGLFGPQDPERNAALVLTWGLWEPLLVLSTFFVARMWCSVCPVGALSTLIRRLAGLNLSVPSFIRDYGFYLTAAGIAAIFWSEAATRMISSPRATAMLVLSIVVLAAVSGFLFQRSAWCRHLCPLGGMVGLLSNCSILELRSNYGICNTSCTKHDCYTGTDLREGCPMFEGPFAVRSNQNCVVCGSCIKICPNRSPVLNLRLPGYDLWAVQAPEKGFAVLGMALIGTQMFRGIGYLGYGGLFYGDGMGAAWFSTFLLISGSILMAVFYAIFAGRAVFGRVDSSGGRAEYRMVYVLMPLAFACEAGYHVEKLFTMGGRLLPVLGRQLGFAIQLPSAGASPLTVKTFQVLLVMLGAVGSMSIIGKMLREQRGGGKLLKLSIRDYWPILVLTLVYLVIFLLP